MKRSQRRYPRRTLRISVRHLCKLGEHSDPATTLGAGGLFLQTSAPLEVGSPIELRFRLPGSRELHEISGEVVWRRGELAGGAPRGAPGVGIRFTDRVARSRLAVELERLP